MFDRKTVTYNEHGDPAVELFEHEEREYSLDEEGRIADSPTRENVSRSEARFRYDYDPQGNWVSKAVEGRPWRKPSREVCGSKGQRAKNHGTW